ncbi:hypothetical protein QUB16_07590, partial [Microcoleus sp. D3_18a_C4]
PTPATSNTHIGSVAVEVLPGKSLALSEGEAESLRQELDAVRIENQRLQSMLDNSETEREKLNQQLEEARSQLETVQVNPPTTPVAKFKLPEAGRLLNQLKAKRKKSKCDLADLEEILDMLDSLLP